MRTCRPSVIAIALAVSVSPAFAQVTSADKNPPGTSAPSQFDSQSPQSQQDSLSERLERSGGVIKPPDHADKEIHLTPPPTGDDMNLPPSALPPAKNPTEKQGTPK
jgi:hypothetical protein